MSTPQITIDAALMTLKPTMNAIGQQLFPIVQVTINKAHGSVVAELAEVKQQMEAMVAEWNAIASTNTHLSNHNNILIERDAAMYKVIQLLIQEDKQPELYANGMINELVKDVDKLTKDVNKLAEEVAVRTHQMELDSHAINELTMQNTELSERVLQVAELKRELQIRERMYKFAISESEKWKKLYKELKMQPAKPTTLLGGMDVDLIYVVDQTA
jgi:chromosome segregation ATPase